MYRLFIVLFIVSLILAPACIKTNNYYCYSAYKQLQFDCCSLDDSLHYKSRCLQTTGLKSFETNENLLQLEFSAVIVFLFIEKLLHYLRLFREKQISVIHI